MSYNVLLVGRLAAVLGDVEQANHHPDVTFHKGTDLDTVRRAMADAPIDTVIMGAGLDLRTRLAIIEHVFTTSTTATVHLKNVNAGAAGMVPFTTSVLTGLGH